ncbi:MAG: hypothetical protein ACREBW_03300 [Candidatus Micrarchaeaceae archaeon]
MNTRPTTKKTTSATKTKATNALILKDLPLDLLTPEQFEAVTKANYYHPESRLILQLFLKANYIWQLARKIQDKPSSIDTIDWSLIEKNTARLINETLNKLLTGVTVQVPTAPVEQIKKKKSLPKQACGCHHKHSDAAGVVEACLRGQTQGQDESWTGY